MNMIAGVRWHIIDCIPFKRVRAGNPKWLSVKIYAGAARSPQEDDRGSDVQHDRQPEPALQGARRRLQGTEYVVVLVVRPFGHRQTSYPHSVRQVRNTHTVF